MHASSAIDSQGEYPLENKAREDTFNGMGRREFLLNELYIFILIIRNIFLYDRSQQAIAGRLNSVLLEYIHADSFMYGL